MQENTEEVRIKLVNDKVKFEGTSEANPLSPISFDYKAPIGDGEGYNGLELLLMSFSGCCSTAVVYLLRKMKKDIKEFNLHAIGERTTNMPIKFSNIKLSINLISSDTTKEELDKCIKMAEEQICPVWQMIKNNVLVEATSSINKPV